MIDLSLTPEELLDNLAEDIAKHDEDKDRVKQRLAEFGKLLDARHKEIISRLDGLTALTRCLNCYGGR